MADWFEGSTEIACSMDDVRRSFGRPAEHYLAVVEGYPGMSGIDLVEATPEAFTITTDEGVMRRTGVTVHDEGDSLTVELDEEYAAGSKVTATSHVVERFSPSGDGVTYHLVIRDVEAPGALGFVYRRFGSRNIGTGFLEATRAHLEAAAD